MKKQLVLMFLLGAVFGYGLSAFHFSGKPAEIKVLTKTEYKEVPVNTFSIQNDSREQTKFPEHQPEDSEHEADEIGKYESRDVDSSEDLSQMDKFERSMAGASEEASVPSPEEAQSPGEPPMEETSEN